MTILPRASYAVLRCRLIVLRPVRVVQPAPIDQSAITAIALISIRYSGEVILVISTMVEAGGGE